MPWSTRHACARTQIDVRGLSGFRRLACPLPSYAGSNGHANQTVEKRFRGDPRRNSQRYPYAFTSRLLSSLLSLTFITIPHGLRYRAFARGRGPLPTVLTHDWPFPIFPDSPSPFTNGPNVGHVTLGQDATYLLPILISIFRHASHVYLSLIMLLTLSSARLSSFAFHIMISFSRIRPSPADFGPHVGASGFIVHSSSSPSSSRSHHTHCIVFVSHRFLCSLTHGWSTSRTGRLYLGSSTSVTNQVVLTNETELTTL